MTRDEIITKVQNLINQAYRYDINSKYYEDLFDEVEKLRQPPTLAECLCWEEGQEYEWRGDKYRIQSDILQVFDKEDEMWFDSSEELNDYLRLRQAKKVEPKPKAWRVRDEYSFKCLMKELEEQGYTVDYNHHKPTRLDKFEVYEGDTVVVEVKQGRTINYNSYRFIDKDFYEIIDYHKEEPKYYARYKGTVKLQNGFDYWNIDSIGDYVIISDKEDCSEWRVKVTKSEWAKYGITDENAVFEEVK